MRLRLRCLRLFFCLASCLKKWQNVSKIYIYTEKCLVITRKSNNFAPIYKLMEIIIHLKDKRDMRMKSFLSMTKSQRKTGIAIVGWTLMMQANRRMQKERLAFLLAMRRSSLPHSGQPSQHTPTWSSVPAVVPMMWPQLQDYSTGSPSSSGW